MIPTPVANEVFYVGRSRASSCYHRSLAEEHEGYEVPVTVVKHPVTVRNLAGVVVAVVMMVVVVVVMVVSVMRALTVVFAALSVVFLVHLLLSVGLGLGRCPDRQREYRDSRRQHYTPEAFHRNFLSRLLFPSQATWFSARVNLTHASLSVSTAGMFHGLWRMVRFRPAN